MENDIERKHCVNTFNHNQFQGTEHFNIHPTTWYKIIEESGDGVLLKYFIDDFIKNVSFENLIQFAVAIGSSSLYCIEVNGKPYLIKYYYETVSKILDNGSLVVYTVISNILFTEVDEYRKLIIYNHAKVPNILYQNQMDNDIDNGYRCVLAIWRHRIHIRDIISKVISEIQGRDELDNEPSHYQIKSTDLEVLELNYVDNRIKKVSFEDLVEMVVANKHKSVRFLEFNGSKYLVNYTSKSRSKKMDNGIYISKTIISNVQYAEVKDYKRFIIYDHLRSEMCKYVDNLENLIKKSSIYVVIVWNYQSKYLRLLQNAIEKDMLNLN
ncbi:MAG: hypothetical protein ACFFDN_14145 [Candidatus Hodarchaeota archaeon]